MVDKQIIGRVEGFRLGSGEDPAATAECAPLLAEYYEQQAERFAVAANGALAMDQNGFVRWTGWLVARLTAGETALQPGFVLLADDNVSPAAREKIAQRVRRFIAFYTETALKPLTDLAGAEALLPKPRFIALRLVEQLGLVPRREIAAELKELDQEARAALRRFGVRFGVYHVFMPALLKPTPAQALTLLWAVKHNACERPGYGDIVAQLTAGRTSFAAEGECDRAFYRLAGYRLLGKRAVRIDMLERCADLIRQAAAWRPGNAEPRPEGAYDGRHFTISQAMLSILGIRPDDMEEILRQLGYVAQPVSGADYRAFLQQDKAALAVAAGASAWPAAEPVGDWPAAAPAAADAPPEAEIIAAAAGLSAPAAEPVGPRFAGRDKRIDDIVLLWRYRKRIHKKPHKKEARPERRGSTHRSGVSAGRDNPAASMAAGAAAGKHSGSMKPAAARPVAGPKNGAKKSGNFGNGKKRNFGKASGSDNYGRHKPINIEDSPFAALMALRDKLRQ